MSDGQIVAFGLTKAFGQVAAVDSLSFVARPDRVTAILGPHRAGKTTILRLLLNLQRPTAGCIMIDGFAYRELADPQATIGAVWDAGPSHATAGAGGLSAGAYLRRLCGRRRIPVSRMSELLELVELADASQQPSASLSADEWRRLAIAAALVPDPRFLVRDEPDHGLNAVGMRWMQALLGHLTSAGHTIVFVTRTPSHVKLLADDVIEIAAGCLVAQGRVGDVVAHAVTAAERPAPGP